MSDEGTTQLILDFNDKVANNALYATQLLR